jgi:hypothetical protein
MREEMVLTLQDAHYLAIYPANNDRFFLSFEQHDPFSSFSISFTSHDMHAICYSFLDY